LAVPRCRRQHVLPRREARRAAGRRAKVNAMYLRAGLVALVMCGTAFATACIANADAPVGTTRSRIGFSKPPARPSRSWLPPAMSNRCTTSGTGIAGLL
jgi:hypothetical protein